VKRETVYVGSMIKLGELFAVVDLIFEDINKIEFKTDINIKFDQVYSYRDLVNMEIPLPYYTRTGKSWTFKSIQQKIIIPEIERLKSLGFEIEDTQNNPALLKWMTKLI
jgi:hypothetical protein